MHRGEDTGTLGRCDDGRLVSQLSAPGAEVWLGTDKDEDENENWDWDKDQDMITVNSINRCALSCVGCSCHYKTEPPYEPTRSILVYCSIDAAQNEYTYL